MDFLVNPDKFFSEHKNIGFKLPVVIVLISAIISMLTAHFSYETVLDAAMKGIREQSLSENQIEIFKPIIYVSTVGGAFIAVFMGWIMISLILYGLSAIFRGKGSFGILMKFLAFSFIPVILLSPITLYLSYEAFVIRNPDALTASIIFGIVLYVWQFVYWIFAVKNAREISLKQSMTVSAVILVIFLSISIYTLLQPSILEMLG